MLRVTVVYTGLQGMPAVSQYYFDGDDISGAEAAADAVQAYHVLLQDTICDAVSVDISSEVVYMNPANGEIIDYFTVSGGIVEGQAAFEPLPIGTSLVQGFLTAGVVNGRRVQGRCYLPGLTEDAVGPTGVLTPGYVFTSESWLESALGTAVPQQCVWSRPFEGDEDNAPRAGSTHIVTDYRVPAVLSSLRTRRR